MGNILKNVVNSTLNFFSKIKDIIIRSSKKVYEVVINGVKRVVTYFKKIIEFCWKGIKIIAKLIYYKGKQLISILADKVGIPYIIRYLQELKNKNVSIRDERNNIIDPKEYLSNLGEQMEKYDQIKLKVEIVKNDNSVQQSQSVKDFEENDDDEISNANINEYAPIAKTENKEYSLDINEEADNHSD